LRKLDEENLDLLKQTPSAILGSVRHCLNTKFDEELYLYKTFTKFIYQGHVYRICFDLEGETDWQEEISKLLA